ncbi:hypothetical protein [Thiolapillus sp.]
MAQKPPANCSGYLAEEDSKASDKPPYFRSTDESIPKSPFRLEQELLRRTQQAGGSHLDQAKDAFRKDHWLGLAQLGMNLEKASRKVAGFVPRPDAPAPVLELDDLALLVTNDSNCQQDKIWALKPPDNDPLGGFDAQVFHGKVPNPRPVLVLVTQDQNDLLNSTTQLSYTGSLHYRRFFCELMLNHRWRSVGEMYLQLGRHTLDFQMVFCNAGSRNTSRFISMLLSTVLWSGRPLRHYSATFFCPIPIRKENGKQYQLLDGQHAKFKPKVFNRQLPITTSNNKIATGGDQNHKYHSYNEKEIDAQVLSYFSPRIREQLFNFVEPLIRPSKTKKTDSKILPIEEHRYDFSPMGTKGISLIDCDSSKQVDAILENVSLYRHHLGQDILAFRITMNLQQEDEKSWMNCNSADGDRWWIDLFKNAQPTSHYQLESWLNLTRLFRVLYPTFTEQWKEKKISGIRWENEDYPFPEGNMGKLNGLVESFVRKFYTETDAKQALKALREDSRDDRMFVSVAYALAGEAPPNECAKAEYRRLFDIALHIDRQQDAGTNGTVYDPGFNRENAQQQIYNRWEHLGTLYGLTDHSTVCTGFGRVMREKITACDIPHIYSRLTLINLSYKSLFHYFEYKISELTPEPTSRGKYSYQRLKRLRDHFMVFTNRYWFHDVTEQQQGKDIYRMQSQQLGLRKLYNQIQEEIEKTHEYDQSCLRDRLSCMGIFFSFISLFMGFVNSSGLRENIASPLMAWATPILPGSFLTQAIFFMSVSIALLLAILAIHLFILALGIKTEEENYYSAIKKHKKALIGIFFLPMLATLTAGFLAEIGKAPFDDQLLLLYLVFGSAIYMLMLFFQLLKSSDPVSTKLLSCPLAAKVGVGMLVFLLLSQQLALTLVVVGIAYLLAYMLLASRLTPLFLPPSCHIFTPWKNKWF